ncbi:thioredoxin-like protein [Tribonema minus]|uniref:Thioredoxin-like protein n=1 Tax=Tribonema minus TaxID=303371 RepID=A0A835YNU3_9STRA|nr:thioredoxin-like protein [Tribonema minus]
MGDRGHTSVPLTDKTTEWDDILIRKGILTRDEVLRNKGVDPDELRLQEAVAEAREELAQRNASMTLTDKLAEKSLDELDALEDDFADDDGEEEILQRLRQARIVELKAKAARARFGSVIEISKGDWVAEVTEASANGDLWVVAHLYQDSVVECRVMEAALRSVAARFPEVKFVRIRSTQAVENWPDANLPTLFVYRGGALARQLITAAALGGKRMTADDLEWYLAQQGIVETELEGDPREGGGGGANVINVRRRGAPVAAAARREARRRDSDGDSDYDDSD